jgi:hypothetical protein
VLRHGLPAAASCDEPCAGTVRLMLSRRDAARLGVRRVAASRRLALRGRPKLRRFRVRFGADARRRLARARSLRATLVVSLADRSRHRRTVRRAVKLRR